MVIVQHRGIGQDGSLLALLSRQSSLVLVEAEDKMTLAPGHAYLAPADYHLLIEEPGSVALSTDPPVRSARPSIDVLFESAAHAYRDRVAGVVLTGASADGADGLRTIKSYGGAAVIEDPATAECAIDARRRARGHAGCGGTCPCIASPIIWRRWRTADDGRAPPIAFGS